MTDADVRRRLEAAEIFKLGVKANAVGVHRTLNRPPKGKGWVQCVNSPAGVVCKPDKVRESIEHFKKAYDIFPDIAALNQIALAYEMLGELDAAVQYFERMKVEAARGTGSPPQRQINAIYVKAAETALGRIGSTRRG